MAVEAGVYIDGGGMISCAMDGGESCHHVLADEDASMSPQQLACLHPPLLLAPLRHRFVWALWSSWGLRNV